jgi:protocatechuate 3,4-dioxygenase, alpha subunit
VTNRLSNRLGQTPSQTVGPYFAYGLTSEQYGYEFSSIATPSLVDENTPGERIRLTGQVLDGEGKPVNDAIVEILQADTDGKFGKPSFSGFGRCGTGTTPDNRYFFDTVKPGRVGQDQAPHIDVVLFMRGLLSHVFTRIYFDDERAANAADPVLASVPEDRRGTLIARRETLPSGTAYRFDIHMQGERETVFFDV